MRVLVTGASGFLGSWFLNHFIKGDFNDIWSVDLVPHPTLGGLVDQQDMVEWLADFDEQVDLVVHMASPVGGRTKIELDPMYNADALRLDSAMFRWAVEHAKTVVYPSSSAVYPVSLQGKGGSYLLHEGFISARDPNWGKPDELYGLTKLVGEYLAKEAADKYGLNVLCIRPFSGYGPHQSLDYPVPAILTRAINHEDPLHVWGSGKQKRDFVYVTDIVDATIARLEAGIEGYETMNISSGFGVSFLEVAKLAAEIEGYDPQIQTLPDEPEGVQDRRGDPSRMERHFQLTVPLRKGLTWTMDSLRNPQAPVELSIVMQGGAPRA